MEDQWISVKLVLQKLPSLVKITCLNPPELQAFLVIKHIVAVSTRSYNDSN